MTETGISMSTVPETVGVKIRRNSASRSDIRNWKRAETSTRVASMPGPLSASALMQTAIKAEELPIMRTWPIPKRPSRSDWSIVAAPPTATAATTAHDR